MAGKRKGPVGKSSTEAKSARRKASALHAKADVVHRRSGKAHAGAHTAHLKVEALEAEIRRQAASPVGKPLPPKTGAMPLRKSEERGSPVMPASYGAAPQSKLPFSVVGIGASAGGYEAFTTFLSNLPKETGMAFVLVQHLDPSHESHLGELLSKVSALPVTQIKTGTEVKPDQVYVIPSNSTVVLQNGRFKLSARLNSRGVTMSIDTFFRSLAIEQQNRAIGVLFSGSGTDGTLGLGEIKGEGGITLAQDQRTAKHFGMPGSAISAGVVDFVMSPEQIARELTRLSGHPYVTPHTQRDGVQRAMAEGSEGHDLFRIDTPELRTLFTLLRTRTNVDFSLYKPGTLNRRIMRRMVLHKIDSIEQYVRFLQENPGEVEALFGDLLISVTGFFRDPSSFRALQKKILPRLLRERPANAPLRIWSCGCSTGEEAYSLAIVVSEFLEQANKRIPVQIFASDLNDRGIEKARAGIYHENIVLDVSHERLRRFFTRVNGFYQINKSIRDLCVFARQNIVTDPPFSNLDLISCRNVLIYLAPVLQKRIMPVFHYALKPKGFLLLGSSESIGESGHLFELVDRKHKIYAKKSTAYRPAVNLGRLSPRDIPPPVPRHPARKPEGGAADLHEKVDRVILTRHSPDGVLIDSRMDVVQFRGQTGPFFEHQPGTASLNLLKMVREELSLDVRRAVTSAMRTGHRTEHRAARIELRRGVVRDVLIEVDPITTTADGERFFLVLLREVLPVAEPGADQGKKGLAAPKTAETRVLTKLKEELSSTKESLQAIIEEQEATNEELKSANEEIQSSNEELQSTNEELETAREELQSTNEELTTLNQELQTRNTELAHLNNDLTNLLNSVNIAVVILGRDLSIRRFTPTAEKLFNLIPSDVGRRLTDLTRNIRIPDLEGTIANVIENLSAVEQEVQDAQGRWYALRIRPYRTQDSRIDGVVLMLLDIEEFKRAMVQMVGIVRHPLLLLYDDLRVSRANDAFCRFFHVAAEETENRSLYELGNGQWNIPKLRELLEEILPKHTEIRDYLVEHDFPKIGKRRIMVNARRFYDDNRGVQRIAIAFEEITCGPKG